jgi:hypothetical protein
MALEFGNVLFFGVHRLTVDTYALQHPEAYCASAKSFVAHLTGLCAAMDRADPPGVNASVQRWLSRNPPLARPIAPEVRGRLTVGDVQAITDPSAYRGEVEAWARSTWEAYASLHELARAWIEESRAGAALVPHAPHR